MITKLDDFIIGRRNSTSRQPTAQEMAATAAFSLKGQIEDSAILLLHGMFSTPFSIRQLGYALHDAGFSVSAPLLAGHGTNLEDFANSQWQDWLNSAMQAYQTLSTNYRNVIVVAQSMGGLLALQLAYRLPSIKHLVLLSTALALPNPLWLYLSGIWSLNLLGLHNIIVNTLGGDLKKPDALEIGYRTIPLATLKQLILLIKKTRLILPNITANTLAYYSPADHVISSKRSSRWLRKIAGPCDIRWVDHSYHILSSDNDFETILAGINEHLSSYQSLSTT